MLSSRWWVATCVIWIAKFMAAEEISIKLDIHLWRHTDDLWNFNVQSDEESTYVCQEKSNTIDFSWKIDTHKLNLHLVVSDMKLVH